MQCYRFFKDVEIICRKLFRYKVFRYTDPAGTRRLRTLGFGCILVTTSDNVVTMLCFRRRYHDQKLKLLQRCVFNVGFPDENLKVFQYHYNFLFSKICNIAMQFHFLINKIYSLCVNTKRGWWWISHVVQWLKIPCFLAVNSVRETKHEGIMPICYDDHTNPFEFNII